KGVWIAARSGLLDALPAVSPAPGMPRHSITCREDLAGRSQVPEQDTHHTRSRLVGGCLRGEVDTDLEADHNRLGGEPVPPLDRGQNPLQFAKIRLLNLNLKVRAPLTGSSFDRLDKGAAAKPCK